MKTKPIVQLQKLALVAPKFSTAAPNLATAGVLA